MSNNYDNIPTQRVGSASHHGTDAAPGQEDASHDGHTRKVDHYVSGMPPIPDSSAMPPIPGASAMPPIPGASPIPDRAKAEECLIPKPVISEGDVKRVTAVPATERKIPVPTEAATTASGPRRIPVFAPEPTRVVSCTRHVDISSVQGETSAPAETPSVAPEDWPMAVLVVISGAMKGQILTVRRGQNSLGRGAASHICMAKDPFVSSENHLFITCRVDEGKFSLRPGNGRGVTYLNDEFLESSVTLKEGDVIRLSERSGVDDPTQLLFLPIIREGFRWNF